MLTERTTALWAVYGYFYDSTLIPFSRPIVDRESLLEIYLLSIFLIDISFSTKARWQHIGELPKSGTKLGMVCLN